jgi:hypothetical protein
VFQALVRVGLLTERQQRRLEKGQFV